MHTPRIHRYCRFAHASIIYRARRVRSPAAYANAYIVGRALGGEQRGKIAVAVPITARFCHFSGDMGHILAA